MAIQPLKMMQFVAPLEHLTESMIGMFRAGAIELVDADRMIETYAFNIPMQESTLAKTVDVATTTSFGREADVGLARRKVLAYLGERERDMGSPFTRDVSAEPTDVQQAVFAKLEHNDAEIAKLALQKAHLLTMTELLRLLNANDIEHDALQHLDHFYAEYGTLTEIGRRTIRAGYAEIPAAVLHLGTMGKEEAYLIVYPKKVEKEIRRLEGTLNWKRLNPDFPDGLTNQETLHEIHHELEDIDRELAGQETEKAHTIERHRTDLQGLYYSMALQESLTNAKAYLAKGRNYFYLSGWVSAADVDAFQQAADRIPDSFVQFLSRDRVETPAPTLLQNNRLVRPFEAMVNMYGTPNYRELDPTSFFALTYCVLFGAMFGDLGQGAVFALLGLALQKMRHPNLGGVVLRMGLGSMIFGVLYGSVFGLEDVIPALLIRPFENINTVLIASIAFGVLLSSVAYVMGIINKWRMDEKREALFGKEGVAGFVLYLAMILLVVNMAVTPLVPSFVPTLLIALCLGAILFQQPLSNLIFGKRPLHDQALSDYYVESGFSLLETVISIFSGVLSFIRVGAFAINHVGLFMAFSTMGEMMGGAGNIAMIVIGNVVIIGLEGLIVFIQSLRLEYYELFGKYYVGDGKPFVDTKRFLMNR
ncbi:MAG: V-type ATPase 116kDa subunit family protein [Peptoniphilaceae bacterium]|nr:V-type ATPase 116kDa subunit family protein [Peptoniphilaceae bacterium]MDY6085133.1 V-type ATPase 116kDa subunit family protein [Peptoniphilaceae bacterium]